MCTSALKIHSGYFPECKLAAISHGRRAYRASERLLKPLCLAADEPQLQGQAGGSSEVAVSDGGSSS